MQALGLVWDNFDSLNADLSETISPIPAPVHFGAKLLHARWREHEKGGGFVIGRDVPSRQLSGILRNLAIFEPEVSDFRVRLAGTAFLRRFGRDITGLKLSEIFKQPNFEFHRDSMAEIVKTGVPSALDVKLKRKKRTILHCEALRLPVISPDRKGTWILSGLFFHE